MYVGGSVVAVGLLGAFRKIQASPDLTEHPVPSQTRAPPEVGKPFTPRPAWLSSLGGRSCTRYFSHSPPPTFFFFKLELSKHLFTGLDQLRKQGRQSVVPKPQSARRHPKTLWAPCIGQTLLGVKATCPIWARALQTRFEVTTPHFSIAVVLPGESGDQHSYLFFFLSVWFPHNQTIWTRRGYLRA